MHHGCMAIPDGAASALAGDPDTVRGFLLAHSGLPGPRANLELLHLAAEVIGEGLAARFRSDPEVYLVCCGVVRLARTWLEALEPGRDQVVADLRDFAASDSWRVREAVAMALQRIGDDDPQAVLQVALAWAQDAAAEPLVGRAAVAAICEPRLLMTPSIAAGAVEACALATAALVRVPPQRRTDQAVRTLRQGLGYCWSVALAADPSGLSRFEGLDLTDPDLAWIVRENLKKARLRRILNS